MSKINNLFMRKQYHFKKTGSDVLIWDVHRLIELSKHFPIIEIPVSRIKELNENFWFQNPEDKPTCKSICEHFLLINESDLSYPIILNTDGSVMDGMHRICKAHILRLEKIKAVKFPEAPMPDFINKHPDELEY